MNFLIGAISGMFTGAIIQPFDCVKVAIQSKSEAGNKNHSTIGTIIEIYKMNGIKSLYVGLDSAMIRQTCNTGVRLGIFYTLSDFYSKKYKEKPGWKENIALSLIAGCAAAVTVNPLDVAIIRKQADLLLPADRRRNYRHTLHALYMIYKEEDLKGLYTGSAPTLFRSVILSISLLVSFEESKKFLSKINPGASYVQLSIFGSFFAGLFTAFVSLPADNIKTKIQKMQISNNEKPYTGMLDCLTKSVMKEGVSKLWVGIVPYASKGILYGTCAFVSSDYLRKVFNVK